MEQTAEDERMKHTIMNIVPHINRKVEEITGTTRYRISKDKEPQYRHLLKLLGEWKLINFEKLIPLD